MVNDTTATVPLERKPHVAFDLSSMVIAETNFQIDKAIQAKTPQDTVCIVNIPHTKEVPGKLLI